MGYHPKYNRRESRKIIKIIFELPEFMVKESLQFRRFMLIILRRTHTGLNDLTIELEKVPRFGADSFRRVAKSLNHVVTALLNWIHDLSFEKE